MARAFDTATAALALDMPPKWLDNLLSHNLMRSVAPKRQGVPRQLSPESVTILFIAQSLISGLGASRAAALRAASELAAAGSFSLNSQIVITVDIDSVNELIQNRLFDAVQAVPRRKRGRPPSQSSATTGASPVKT